MHEARNHRGTPPPAEEEQPIVRRLRSLALGELVNIPLQAWLWFGLLGFPATAAWARPGRGSWLGLGFALFAVLEHVNYFHLQLMHGTRADLRRLLATGLHRSHLATDLSR